MKNKTSIKGNIHYVGVNDRQKHLFENLWPLPQGISYNSYLIDDKKIALIDTVDVCYFEAHLRKIKSIIGDRPIDYLVINHMEPDHSGSIRLIKQYYPDIILVGNHHTSCMIEGFYGIVDEQCIVNDGDHLELGSCKLSFRLTPMVHWPETMMTYCAREKVLFSGDAFGCFGALGGGFIDDNIYTDIYWEEMVRYYSNIVGKYGGPVQKALTKLGNIPVSAICPAHGPVWTTFLNTARVLSLYRKLSRYDGDDGVVVVYGSMYGNTEQMAEAIAAELSAQGVMNVIVHNLSKSHSSYILSDIFKFKGLIVGCPTYNGQLYPEMEALLSKIAGRDMKNRYFSYFGSFSWAGAAVKKLSEFAEKSNFELVGQPVEMKHAMKEETYAECEALARAMAKKIVRTTKY
ncbi:MAG: FprA family A-type flavoprotein [Mediterranea sp.]|nr:FprA family A-type flavoprotein [Mediterranea sp.]